MILKGSQRGGGRQLAVHLLKDENDHIDLVELRGFMAEDLTGAFDEAHAIAKGTKCRQFLFSLSLNPPQDQVLGREAFQKAADEIEERLGLTGQPRAIVIHEKEGRRHAHAVWSRIDAETMTAKPLPFFKNRLRELSRELYLEHDWKLPDGLRDPLLKNPLNFTREEWQQAQRTARDPREIKQVFREAWARSDGRKAFAAALEERGFVLARGDRRGHVAIDHHGEIYAVSRWVGERTKNVTERLGTPDDLPSVTEAKDRLWQVMTPKLDAFRSDQQALHKEERKAFKHEKDAITTRHQRTRANLKLLQEDRWERETRARAARFRGGVAGLWDRVTGRAAETRKLNEGEAWLALKRDQAERDGLIVDQLSERRALQTQIRDMRARHQDDRRQLDLEIGEALAFEGRKKAAEQRVRSLLRHSRMMAEIQR
tara:strand:+ start:598 stop:1881 length:1284 start_codon:yes stop_codon:yes gene_type:complete